MHMMRRLAFTPLTKPVIHIMGGYNQDNRSNKKIKFIHVKELLADQKNKTKHKN